MALEGKSNTGIGDNPHAIVEAKGPVHLHAPEPMQMTDDKKDPLFLSLMEKITILPDEMRQHRWNETKRAAMWAALAAAIMLVCTSSLCLLFTEPERERLRELENKMAKLKEKDDARAKADDAKRKAKDAKAKNAADANNENGPNVFAPELAKDVPPLPDQGAKLGVDLPPDKWVMDQNRPPFRFRAENEEVMDPINLPPKEMPWADGVAPPHEGKWKKPEVGKGIWLQPEIFRGELGPNRWERNPFWVDGEECDNGGPIFIGPLPEGGGNGGHRGHNAPPFGHDKKLPKRDPWDNGPPNLIAPERIKKPKIQFVVVDIQHSKRNGAEQIHIVDRDGKRYRVDDLTDVVIGGKVTLEASDHDDLHRVVRRMKEAK